MRRRIVAPTAFAALVLLVLQVAITHSGVDPAVLPTPTDVARALWTDRAELWQASKVTGLEVVLGLLLAIVIGLASALAMHRFRLVESATRPWLVASQAVPTPVIAAPLALWLGYTLSTRVVVVALVAYFPIAFATLDGLRRSDPDVLDLYRSFGASRGRVLREVDVPTALPALYSGIRVAAALSVVGAVFGEWVGSSDGLGYLILTATNSLDSALAFACVFLLSLMGIALVAVTSLVEHSLVPWGRALR